MIRVVVGDIFGAVADGIVLPVDGTFVPRADRLDRILGTIGSQFVRRFPTVGLLEEIEGQVDFPIALGQAAAVELPDGPFRVAVLACTLHHAGVFDDASKRAVIRSSFAAALRVASVAGATKLVAPVLQGGWRVAPGVAFREMVASYREVEHPPDVDVHCVDAALAGELEAAVRS